MKHLENFYKYISESDIYSNDKLEELLVPIRDLGVSCDIGDKTTITEGKFSGSEYISVRFSFNDYEKTPGFGYRTDIMSDDRITDYALIQKELKKLFLYIDSEDINLFYLASESIQQLLKEYDISDVEIVQINNNQNIKGNKLRRIRYEFKQTS